MKLSVRLRSLTWAAGAAVVVLILVISLTGASSRPDRAGARAFAPGIAGGAPTITPGVARAEVDTLDLQLD